VNYKYVECILDDLNRINERLKNRNQMISQIKEVNEDMFNYGLHNSKRPSEDKYLVVDTNQPLENYMDEVIHYLTLEKNHEITR
jgi:hypothetical protein